MVTKLRQVEVLAGQGTVGVDATGTVRISGQPCERWPKQCGAIAGGAVRQCPSGRLETQREVFRPRHGRAFCLATAGGFEAFVDFRSAEGLNPVRRNPLADRKNTAPLSDRVGLRQGGVLRLV